MRIAIEGMDGVGKTTVAKTLAAIYNFKYVDKPFKFLFEKMGFTESLIKQMEWKLYETYDEALIATFYGLGLLYGTRNLDADGIIYDRHFASNYYWHGNAETDSLHNEFIRLCGMPDLTILLKASVDVRLKRIMERNNKDLDLSNSAMYDDGYKKMIDFLDSRGFNYVIIDTENKSKNQVVSEAIKVIEEYKMTAKESRCKQK